MSWQTIVKEKQLAVSEINLKDLVARIDAEYYDPKYIENVKKIKSKEWKILKELSEKITDFGAYSQNSWVEYLEEGKHIFIRNQDIEGFFIKTGDKIYISEEVYKKLSLKLEELDILVQRAGTLGKASIILAEDLPSTANQNLAQIKIDKKLVSPFYIIAFLNSRYGISSFERLATGNVQPWLNLEQINNLPIPLSNESLQEKITEIITKAKKVRDNSKARYTEAENLLLREIALENFSTTDKNISIRNFKNCIVDNRFDSEYWLPDFDVILAKISKYKNGVSTIGDEFKQLKGNFKPEKGLEYNYVEIGDVNVSTGEVGYNIITSAELPANAKIRFGRKQLITSKVRPNRGATAILGNHEGFIGSGAFTVLVEKDLINLETLMVYLKAKPIRELLLRYNTGTSYPVITDADVLKLPIPLVDKAVQKKISELVSISAKERHEAKELLEKSKRAVEIFVEKDEKEALKYLKQ